jgi:plastocyanin
MKRRSVFQSMLLGTAALSGLPLRAWADEGHKHDDDDQDANRLSVTVAFGAGLNTAQPGNAANHHVLPGVIKVRRGGVVSFIVSGFHQIFVYNPGTTAAMIPVPAAGTFINYLTGLYYQGIVPVAPPAAVASNPTSVINRVESVSFAEPGDYLVICNVRPHFLDGMMATIKVR